MSNVFGPIQPDRPGPVGASLAPPDAAPHITAPAASLSRAAGPPTSKNCPEPAATDSGRTAPRRTHLMSATAQNTSPPDVHQHQARIEQLRQIADWLERHPDERIDSIAEDFERRMVLTCYAVNTAEDLAAIALRLGGRWNKDASAELFYLEQEIAPNTVYRLVAWRNDVCTRIVTGTETRTVVEPDPQLVAALPTVERVETVDTYEWRCEPLLTARQAA